MDWEAEENIDVVSSSAIKIGKLTLPHPPPTTYNTIMIMSSKVNIITPPPTNA